MDFSKITDVVSSLGGVLTGVSDVSSYSNGHPRAIVAAVPIDRFIIAAIKSGPTREYIAAYYYSNDRLKRISEGITSVVRDSGFSAQPLPVTVSEAGLEKEGCGPDTPALTHKVAAYLAGLGLFGRSGLLLSPEYGSAVRFVSVLTDAPLDTGKPLAGDPCGECRACVGACPAEAIKGAAWYAGIPRAETVDVDACKETAYRLTLALTGQAKAVCGACIAACPLSQ